MYNLIREVAHCTIAEKYPQANKWNQKNAIKVLDNSMKEWHGDNFCYKAPTRSEQDRSRNFQLMDYYLVSHEQCPSFEIFDALCTTADLKHSTT